MHESKVNLQLLLCVGEHKDYFRANFWIVVFVVVPPGTVRAYPQSPTRCNAHSAKKKKKKREQYPVPYIGADPPLSHFNTFSSFPFLFSFQGVRRGDSEDMVRLR